MDTIAPFNIPQSDGGVEAGRGQDEVHVWIVCARSSGTPLDGVDLLLVSLQVMNTCLSVHGPHFESHVVTAGGQELALRVPFDGIHLISMALEWLDGSILAQLTNMDLLVSGARGKTLLRLPVHIESWSWVEGKLLLAVASSSVPDNCCPA